jgi:hypothetical protein
MRQETVRGVADMLSVSAPRAMAYREPFHRDWQAMEAGDLALMITADRSTSQPSTST